MSVPTFTHQPLSQILDWLRSELGSGGEARLLVPDPDAGHALNLYPGETGPAGVHRPYLSWQDAADLLGAHFLTPTPAGDLVQLHFRRRQTAPRDRSVGRYAAGSEFSRIDKLEDPHFLHDLSEALTRAALQPGARVLSLGVNGGRELALLEQVYPGHAFQVLGLDLEPSALEAAQARHPAYDFRVQDVTQPGLSELGRYDAVLALSLLQSPGVVQEDLLRALRSDVLAPSGTLILGFPNARYRGGELSYGARMLNFTRPDLSLLMRDVTSARRHLQRHGFTVYVTGKYEVLVTGVRREGRS
ncbi:class I SAM-dependent methyltransferase [Deinococcus altitudinis]|uniref:class I SAM-dependent methyltransferase n=1 Tax=Deinococcus altitudinis TaxID=468914 RepID=UPI00389197C7